MNQVLSDNPRGFWILNDAAGSPTTAADISGHNFIGTYETGVTPQGIAGPSWVSGSGSVARFDGGNISFATPLNLGVNGYTIEAWINPTLASLQNPSRVVASGRGFDGYGCGTTAGGQLIFTTFAQQDYETTLAVPLLPNQWYYVGVVMVLATSPTFAITESSSEVHEAACRTMANPDSRVTIHMAASLDGFIARRDGRVDWMETSDEFAAGDTMDPALVEAFLKTIDCYVMGSRTYETALRFEAEGLGWAYGEKPTFVLTNRDLPRTRSTVHFYSGDLARLVNERLRPSFRSIWFVGGGVVSAECLRLGLADEIRYSILPILIGDGIAFFESLDKDIVLHIAEVKAYKTGMVALRYEVRR